MEYKHAIVIDKKGFKVEFVLAAITVEAGQIIAEPMYYTLQEEESLVFDGLQEAQGMVKPQWTKNRWRETATEEEIEAARYPTEEWELIEPEPDPRDLAIAELSVQLAQTQMAMAEITMMMGGMQ